MPKQSQLTSQRADKLVFWERPSRTWNRTHILSLIKKRQFYFRQLPSFCRVKLFPPTTFWMEIDPPPHFNKPTNVKQKSNQSSGHLFEWNPREFDNFLFISLFRLFTAVDTFYKILPLTYNFIEKQIFYHMTENKNNFKWTRGD